MHLTICRRIRSLRAAAVFFGALLGLSVPATAVTIEVQRRDASGQPFTEQVDLDPSKTVIIESDIWNNHWDVAMTARVGSVVPRVNDGFEAARALGIPVLHAQADIPTPVDVDPLRQKIAGIADVPLPPWPGTGFFNPVPSIPYLPYYPKMAPPGVSPPGQLTERKVWTDAHPDMVIDPARDVWMDAERFTTAYGAGSWRSSSRDLQELHNYTSARDIDTVIYFGGATNISALLKGFGMVQAKRLGMRVIVATDMSFTFTGNGYNHHTNQPDLSLSPDKGERDVNAWIEKEFDGTFNFAQLLATQPQFAYTARVSQEPGLVSYWRLDGSNGNTHVQDINRVQGAWNVGADGTAAVALGAPGAIVGDDNTAAHFDGSHALLVSPMFRNDTPTGSPLTSLSSGSFSIEAWVQADTLNQGYQWIVTHDEGNNATNDFLLGLNNNNRFRFITRGMSNDVSSDITVQGADVASDRWFHLVGVQDVETNQVKLFVDGELAGSTPLSGTPQSLTTSLQIGSRGMTAVGSNGAITNAGSQSYNGQIDEVAIYDVALDSSTIREHFLLGTGQPIPESALKLSIDRQTGIVSLTNNTEVDQTITDYEIRSAVGALEPSGWSNLSGPVSGQWAVTSEEPTQLSEVAASGQGLTIAVGESLEIGTVFTTGPWQDIEFSYSADQAEVIEGIVSYGGGFVPLGDFDGSGSVGVEDWATFVANFGRSFIDATTPLGHQHGDMNGDKRITMEDFVLFEAVYQRAQASSVPLGSPVPEPASGWIAIIATWIVALHERVRSCRIAMTDER